VESVTFERKVWYGGASDGTNNVAEIMAYVIPLTWYLSRELDRRRETSQFVERNVHIITDSQYCRQQSDSSPNSPGSHSHLWRLFDEFPRRGIRLHWHWQERMTVSLNVYADELAGLIRRLLSSDSAASLAIQSRLMYELGPVAMLNPTTDGELNDA